ncbi:MAG: HD domain-containing protein [Pseudomonadota bacterium]
MKSLPPAELSRVADFLFEAGALQHTPRSGFQYLGTGRQSVAEHSLRSCFVAWTLARLEPSVDARRLLELVLFHDLPEVRTGDLNYVNKLYVKTMEAQAWKDLCQGLAFGPEIAALAEEFTRNESREARLAHDADQLDMLLALKEQLDSGNPRAAGWIPAVRRRLTTEAGRQLAEAILEAEADRWWLGKVV